MKRYVSRCPAHKGEEKDLEIHEDDTGRVFFRCGKGCSTEAILAALGLRHCDLVPSPDEPEGRRRP
jgi:hypothetical protein